MSKYFSKEVLDDIDHVVGMLEDVGGVARNVMYTLTKDVWLSVDPTRPDGKPGFLYSKDTDREALANQFLTAFPALTITREGLTSYAPPEMVSRFEAPNGTKFRLDFGQGTCEKVKVGTRKVKAYPKEIYENVEMIEVEEDVYEYICTDDPLAELV